MVHLLEEPPMDVAVALEHGAFLPPDDSVVAPYPGPNTAKLGGSCNCRASFSKTVVQ